MLEMGRISNPATFFESPNPPPPPLNCCSLSHFCRLIQYLRDLCIMKAVGTAIWWQGARLVLRNAGVFLLMWTAIKPAAINSVHWSAWKRTIDWPMLNCQFGLITLRHICKHGCNADCLDDWSTVRHEEGRLGGMIFRAALDYYGIKKSLRILSTVMEKKMFWDYGTTLRFGHI